MSTYRVPRAHFHSKEFADALASAGEMMSMITVEWDPMLGHDGGVPITSIPKNASLDDVVSAYIVHTTPTTPPEPSPEQAQLLGRWRIDIDGQSAHHDTDKPHNP